VIESFRHEARRKSISVNLSIDNSYRSEKTFRTDAEKLRLILSNLLSNAINFSHEGNRVEINGWYEDENLCFEVKDYGIGISDENINIIFDRFKRVDSGINSLNRGHGLGLSVNKAIIDMLNGSISVTSEFGKGTSVSFRLPELDESTSDFASEANEFFFEGDEETF